MKVRHHSPYQGVHEIANFTVPQEVMSIFPIGLYRTNVNVFDESSDTKIFISLRFEGIN